jgi:hypothetical protein
MNATALSKNAGEFRDSVFGGPPNLNDNGDDDEDGSDGGGSNEYDKMEGFLLKKGSNVMKPWQSRYFHANGHYVKYYKNLAVAKNKDFCLCAIDLNLVEVVYDGKGKHFELKLNGGKSSSDDVYLKAASSAEAKEWVTGLRRLQDLEKERGAKLDMLAEGDEDEDEDEENLSAAMRTAAVTKPPTPPAAASAKTAAAAVVPKPKSSEATPAPVAAPAPAAAAPAASATSGSGGGGGGEDQDEEQDIPDDVLDAIEKYMQYKGAFMDFDKNGDGTIDAGELLTVCCCCCFVIFCVKSFLRRQNSVAPSYFYITAHHFSTSTHMLLCTFYHRSPRAHL